jgi:hypothetical protein
MEVKEYLNYRIDLLKESMDEDGFINESSFISTIIPSLLDVKLVDSEDFTDTYIDTIIEGASIKINGYLINDSGERLQLFIVNEQSVSNDNRELEVSQKEYYANIFKKATNFTNKSIKGHLNGIQESGSINALINKMASSSGADQFDVIEIFLVSATATIETRGQSLTPKRIEFEDESIRVKYLKGREEFNKDILVIKRLIDLNFLYDVLISQGNRGTLVIDFEEQFGYKIEAIKAADQPNFESYLCVLPANILAQLYKRYSSRLLEKNVRSFLQFKGEVNQGMKNTLKREPERFIAYNNGLTVTAVDKIVETVNDKIFIKSLSDFQIVNGGQTTASIYFSQKEGIDVSKVQVMAKINIVKNVTDTELDDLISNISEYSNSQSKVSKVDLRSRSPQLNKIKSLSESILTPTGRKWFFEKSKGEFSTKLRIAGSGKTKIEKDYPTDHRFTKEQLGKYFCSWGDEPYKVKKGGEAIFRKFLEDITLEANAKNIIIDRNFYELLISKIIFFKSLENIHGTKSKALGQLRSAVVPFSLSVIYSATDGNKKNPNAFDLSKIWGKEGLGDDLSNYMKELMILINSLIKKYSKSDDLGEYSKKRELWDDIQRSKELSEFLKSENSIKILVKYSISKKELELRANSKLKSMEVDFKHLRDNVDIHMKSEEFFKKLTLIKRDELPDSDKTRLQSIVSKIQQKEEISELLVSFTESIINRIKSQTPEVFDQIKFELNSPLEFSYNFILNKYNHAIENAENIVSTFDRIGAIAKIKGVKYDSVFSLIGKNLEAGKPPTINQLYLISNGIGLLLKN